MVPCQWKIPLTENGWTFWAFYRQVQRNTQSDMKPQQISFPTTKYSWNFRNIAKAAFDSDGMMNLHVLYLDLLFLPLNNNVMRWGQQVGQLISVSYSTFYHQQMSNEYTETSITPKHWLYWNVLVRDVFASHGGADADAFSDATVRTLSNSSGRLYANDSKLFQMIFVETKLKQSMS